MSADNPHPPFSSSLENETYAIELTPAGRGAVAVVLVAGPDAVRAVGECFTANSGRSLVDVPINRIVVGRWGGVNGEELVVCRRGEDEIEVHCHGGSAAVEAITSALIGKGCRRLIWQEWLGSARGCVPPRLDFASRRDTSTCEAQIALGNAVTARTAAVLLDQLHGALSSAIHAVIAAVEASEWSQATALLDDLLKHRDLAPHVTTPWLVVLAGPPNVGKSSLINALAGYERAIVSPIPGTTRDVVTITTAIDGWPVQLADTAGLRATSEEIEAAGVALAEGTLAAADLAVLVHDATQPLISHDIGSRQLPERVLHVVNKVDLLTGSDRPGGSGADPARWGAIYTSAKTGEGIAALAAAIGKSLVPQPPAFGEAVPFSAQQIDSLAVACNAVQRRHSAAAVEALQSLLAAR